MAVILTGKKSIKTGTATAKLTYPEHMLELTDCLYASASIYTLIILSHYVSVFVWMHMHN